MMYERPHALMLEAPTPDELKQQKREGEQLKKYVRTQLLPAKIGRFATFFTTMFPQEIYHHFLQTLAQFKRVEPDVTDFGHRRLLKEGRLLTVNGREQSFNKQLFAAGVFDVQGADAFVGNSQLKAVCSCPLDIRQYLHFLP